VNLYHEFNICTFTDHLKTMSKHTDKKILARIDAYVKGTLNEEEVEQLWIDIAKDPVLLERLKTEVNLKKVIEDRNALLRTTSGGGWYVKIPTFIWHIAAVFIIIVIGLVQFLKVDSAENPELFTISEISAAQLETSDGLRVDNLSFTKADSLLNLGFKAAASNNYKEALMHYDSVIQLQTGDRNFSKAHFNNGVIFFNNGDYPEAKSSFQTTLSYLEDYPMLKEKTFWFLSNTHLKLGELEEARNTVSKVYEMNGLFRKDAYRLLRKLDFKLGNLSSNSPAEINK